jgi:hypothetical protein
LPTPADRRIHARYRLLPMYSPVSVRPLNDGHVAYIGHAYDVGEGGIRFELDRAIPPGTPVLIEFRLPGQGRPEDDGPNDCMHAVGSIVRLFDEDEVEPFRMAACFTRFMQRGDQERLRGQIRSGRYALVGSGEGPAKRFDEEL